MGTSVDTQASHIDRHSTAATAPLAARRAHRTAVCLALTLTGVSLGLLSLLPHAPALIWNYTESVPVGLYRVGHGARVKGDIVAVVPTGALRETLDAYDALPTGRLLLKQLAAASGDTICREHTSITINGANAAIAKSETASGRALPAWSGCHVLGAGERFLLAPHPLSFDSRYFGPIDADQILGVAHPLLTLPLSGEMP